MKWLITALFKALMGLVNLVLLPIDYLIQTNLPSLSLAISSVNSFLSWLSTFTTWVLSWIPLNSSFYSLFIALILFKFTIPLFASTIKLVVKWWHALAP